MRRSQRLKSASLGRTDAMTVNWWLVCVVTVIGVLLLLAVLGCAPRDAERARILIAENAVDEWCGSGTLKPHMHDALCER